MALSKTQEGFMTERSTGRSKDELMTDPAAPFKTFSDPTRVTKMNAGLSRRSFLTSCGFALTAIAGGASLSACGQESATSTSSKHVIRDVAQLLIDEMGLEEKVAQLFFVTPEQLVAAENVRSSNQFQPSSLQIPPPCGAIFFASNLETAEQSRELLSGLQEFMRGETSIPLFLGVDEEGGSVQRIGGKEGFAAPFVPSMSEIGLLNSEEAAWDAACSIAANLKDLGFNTDFAPSCDIATSPSSAMWERSFGAEAEFVAQMVTAQVEAFNEEGILCCAKHFPGIGEPEADSHTSMIYTNKSREELDEQLIPFSAAIDAGVPFVMMGHLSLPQITGSDIPASISPDIVQGILRDDLGYDGVVLTDSLSMGALESYCPPEDRAVAAIEAGCDIALMVPELVPAYMKLLDAVTTERITEKRIDESLMRILTLKLTAFPELFDESIQDEIDACI